MRAAFGIVSLLILVACGTTTAGSYSPNDALPQNATQVAWGTFQSMNGKSVSGLAKVYLSNGGGYVIRLEGISVTAEASLQIVVVYNSTLKASTPLVSYSGTRNYSFDFPVGTTFNSVSIYSSTTLRDYGQAPLATSAATEATFRFGIQSAL